MLALTPNQELSPVLNKMGHRVSGVKLSCTCGAFLSKGYTSATIPNLIVQLSNQGIQVSRP